MRGVPPGRVGRLPLYWFPLSCRVRVAPTVVVVGWGGKSWGVFAPPLSPLSGFVVVGYWKSAQGSKLSAGAGMGAVFSCAGVVSTISASRMLRAAGV